MKEMNQGRRRSLFDPLPDPLPKWSRSQLNGPPPWSADDDPSADLLLLPEGLRVLALAREAGSAGDAVELRGE